MKRIIIFFLLASINFAAFSQGFDFIDINNIKARINADGYLFWDEVGSSSFEVPQGSGLHSIFASGIWIGGFDNNGTLKTAAQTYRQGGSDFYPGPSWADTSDVFWHRVWKLSREEIDSFVYEFANGFPDSNYVIPEVIQNWPGDDSISSMQLLPYTDTNQDGSYNFLDGDYPCIKGDQAVAFIINDLAGNHGESGSLPMGIEIHGMAYGFQSADSIVNNTLFLNYKIISRNTTTTLDTCYIGSWTDFDLGNFEDDYVGCDVMRNMYYAYNGDGNDEGSAGYGANPPAQGVLFLKGPEAPVGDGIDNNRDSCIDCTIYHSTSIGDSIVPDSILPEYFPMTNFMVYSNSFAPFDGNPTDAEDFYGYLQSTWRNGYHMIYGGNGYGGGPGATVDFADYMLPGNSDPYFWGTHGLPEADWDEVVAGNVPGDRRCVASTGSFTMNPGAVVCLDFAYVFARANSGGNYASLDSLELASDFIGSYYNTHDELNQCECSLQINPTVNEINSYKNISLYPNPASDNLNLQFSSKKSEYATVIISDCLGRDIFSVPVSISTGRNNFSFSITSFPKGIYYLHLESDPFFSSMKFVKN